MYILRGCSEMIKSVFPFSDYYEGFFVPSKFNYFLLIDNKYVLVNCFSRCVTIIDENEYSILHSNEINSLDALNPDFLRDCINNRILVQKGTDETKVYLEFFDLLCTMKANIGKSFFKIFTTTACNARCFYCFEQGIDIKTMTDDTADAVFQYIKESRCRDKVNLYWFGGEPLCNHRVISRICKNLTDNGIDFSSYIVTNGILFNDSLINEAINNWHLSRCQITLDGMHDEYKRRKNYKIDYDNPLEIVLKNIDQLAKVGVRRIDIRLNIDTNNFESILQLKDYLKEMFGGYRNISIYPAPIQESWFGYNDNDLKSVEKRKELFAAWAEIRDEVEADGLRATPKFEKDLPVSYCMASNSFSTVISPDGKFYTCQNYSEELCYGDLWNGVTNHALYEKWIHPTTVSVDCQDCPLLPECTPFHFCPSGYNECMKKREDLLKRRIRGTYADLLKK